MTKTLLTVMTQPTVYQSSHIYLLSWLSFDNAFHENLCVLFKQKPKATLYQPYEMYFTALI